MDRLGGADRRPVPGRDHRPVTDAIRRACRAAGSWRSCYRVRLRCGRSASAAGDTFWRSTPPRPSALALMLVDEGNTHAPSTTPDAAANRRRIRPPGVPGRRPAGRPGRGRTGGRHPRRHRLPGDDSHLGADDRDDRARADRGPRHHAAVVRGRDPRRARRRHRRRPRHDHHRGVRPAGPERDQRRRRHLGRHVGIAGLHRRQAAGRGQLRLLRVALPDRRGHPRGRHARPARPAEHDRRP